MIRHLMLGGALALVSVVPATASYAQPICESVDIQRPISQYLPVCEPIWPYGTTCNHFVQSNNLLYVDVENCVPSPEASIQS